MNCLDDVTVWRVLHGEVIAAELDALDLHLDGCAGCRALVGAAGLAVGSDRGAPATDELPAGQRLGRYVVARRLGAGAMGVVYAARDPELDRTVAIKLVRPERRSDDARLIREAQAMARVAHPNVIAIHDVGRHGDAVYVAMEQVDGPTLRTWAATRGWDQRLAAVIAVGRGLAAVHAVGLLHRDVKPDNVLVGADGRPRLGDFGLAAVDAPGAGAAIATVTSTITATGAVVGTPAYLAPEVLRGAAATAASDQWSFAITAWEILFGARPFAGADVGALTAAIERGVSPDAAADGPRPVRRTLARALALAPADRHASVAALIAALTPPVRSGRWRIAGAMTAIALAVGVWRVTAHGGAGPDARCDRAAAALGSVWSAATPGRDRIAPALRDGLDRYATRWRLARRALCATEVARADPHGQVRAQCLATGAAGFAAVVAGSAAGDGRAGALAALIDPDECATSPALALYAPVPPDQRAAVAALAATVAQARIAALGATTDAALATLVGLAEQADALGHRPTQAAAHLAVAEVERRRGHYAAADRAAETAALAAAAGHDDLTAARAWLIRVGVAGDRRDLGHAEQWLPHASAAVERAGSPSLLTAQLDLDVGLLALNQGRLDAATVALDRAAQARAAIAGDDAEVARTLSALGHVARLRGELTAARAAHERALAIDRAAPGGHDLDVARDLHSLGGVLRLQGELGAAEAAYREALAVRTAALGADHPDVGLIHNSLGILALDRGQLAVAADELTAARDIFTRHDHLDRAVALANLARVAAARGDPTTALATVEQAIALDRAQLPARHARLADNLIVAARAAAALGQRARLAALLAEAEAAIPDDGAAQRAEVAALRGSTAPPRRVAVDAGPAIDPVVDAGTAPSVPDARPVDAGVDARYVPPPVYGSSQGWSP